MRSLDLKSLEVFRAVAETGSATSAAALLHSTQPSVTRTVAELERRCGFALFERVRLGMRLTAEGTILLETVQRHFEGLASVQSAIAAIRNGDAGSLKTRVLPVVAEGLIPDLLGGFLRERPKVRVLIEIVAPLAMYNSLASDHMDFGVSIGPVPQGMNIELLRIGRIGMRLVVSRRHRLAKAKRVGFDALGGEALVHLPPPHNIRAAVDMMILNTGIRPAMVHEAGTQRSAARLAECADCITFVDSSIAAEFDPRVLVAIPIEPAIEWDVNLIYRKDRRHSKTFLAFLAYLKRAQAAGKVQRSLTQRPHLLRPVQGAKARA